MIRPGTTDDLAAVAAIQSQSAEAAGWNVTEYLAYEFRVAAPRGEVAGFAVWRAVAPDEYELLNLAVAPDSRRRGIGAALVAALPAGRIFLEVRESNAAARALYESQGFRLLGRRKRYYHNPEEDGIVMELQK
ncbi:MAG TPA: ribosomal protein S18-alanine N-acetyltransferase [Bryobacteraceae bacterium]|nr:ribosomal protein S18-alanine N-acetyltransferase [Bryobacteraceae bacterium]